MRHLRLIAIAFALAIAAVPALAPVAPDAWAGSKSDDCCKGK